MQLKDSSALLTAATMTLLGLSCGNAQAKGEPHSLTADMALLYYGESNNRIQAFEPALDITKTYEQDQNLNIHLVLDTLSGASPNGATPSNEVQTFTRASGSQGTGSTIHATTRTSGGASVITLPTNGTPPTNGKINDDRSSSPSTYSIAANRQPMDASFEDTRGAINLSWSSPLNRDWLYSVGGHGSVESDYTSYGINGNINRYLFQKNTTLTLGSALSFDSITPLGGVPVEFSRLALAQSSSYDSDLSASISKKKSDTKVNTDFIFGITQIINMNTLMQFNFSLGSSSGYQTDPYKIVSVIDDRTGANWGGNYKDSSGYAYYIHEKRPDSRLKKAFYWQTKHMFASGNVANLEYRFMKDDWGIRSNTVDFHYRINIGHDYWQSHFRWYDQTAATFYKRYLTSTEYQLGQAGTNALSADYRLGKMTGITVGLKYGTKLKHNKDASVKLEYFHQTNSGDKGFGLLNNQDLYPQNDSLITQFSLSF